MNIVVIGGGEKGKFGNDFCKRAKLEGHRVLILSHKNYKNNDPDHLHANFKYKWLVIRAFKKLINKIDNIDLLVFNTSRSGGPGEEKDFTSSATVDIDDYNTGLYYGVILPHLLMIEALKKMSKGSRFVFLSTKLALDYKRKEYTTKVGYAGIKAYQIQLMIGLSYHNDKGVIGTTVCPHFPYDEPENYKKVFDMAYNYILTFNKNANVEFISHIADFDKF